MSISVDYERIPGYPKERLTNDAVEVEDLLQCDWNDRITLAKELLGFATSSFLAVPHEFNFGAHNIPNIFCVSASIEPQGGISQTTGAYTKARVSAIYRNLDYDVNAPVETGTTLYVTEAIEPASEFLTLNNEKLFWQDGTPIDAAEAPTKVVRCVDWVYTVHHRLHSVPLWVFSLPGTVNSNTVYSYSFKLTFGAGTLLCGNPSLSREITTDGATAWTITVRFTFRYPGWNLFPRVTVASGYEMTWEYVYNASGLLLPYASANFNPIFATTNT